jgi:hypothetical protein
MINDFSDLAAVIESIEFFQKETVSKLKAKLRLFDGSILWIKEIRSAETLDSYSYYWLRPDETAIMGWDNAPHHKNIETYPHHKHVGDLVQSSTQTDLRAVLSFIKEFLD